MDKKNAVLINGHNFFFWNFCETTRYFSLRSQNSEYPRIFRVTGANQNAQKLLSTDLVNTNKNVLYKPVASMVKKSLSRILTVNCLAGIYLSITPIIRNITLSSNVIGQFVIRQLDKPITIILKLHWTSLKLQCTWSPHHWLSFKCHSIDEILNKIRKWKIIRIYD